MVNVFFIMNKNIIFAIVKNFQIFHFQLFWVLEYIRQNCGKCKILLLYYQMRIS
jgi:hypothetical protein